MFRTNDVTIGVVASDVIKELIPMNRNGTRPRCPNKIQLGFTNIIEQGHFLPSFGVSGVDPSHTSLCRFDNSPDILITSNRLVASILSVGNTVCVNNRNLCYGKGSGHFVELFV
jgi:hypothetical protein